MSVGGDPGESFGSAAAEYERGRPGWPEAALDLVPLPREARVVDLAAGTGKLTRVLRRRFDDVVAVEPLDELRTILGGAVPGARALAGRAEAIPLEDGATDAVFVGQAFHWFATDEAVAEIARVLRPGAPLLLLWNGPRPDAPSPLPAGYRERFDELREERVPPTPEWESAIARGPFGELHRAEVDHEQVSSRADVLAFAQSQSWIAVRPEAERRSVLAELGALLPDVEYRFPLRAEVYWAFRA